MKGSYNTRRQNFLNWKLHVCKLPKTNGVHIPYKLAVRFSYARTPFEVHTSENVYHTDANIRMQQRFKLRCTHDQSRRQIATQNDVLSPHPGKFLPFAHQQRNAMEIQTSAHTQPTSPLQCSHDLNSRYHETNSRLRSYLLCYNHCFIPLQASGVLLNTLQLKNHTNKNLCDYRLTYQHLLQTLGP
jgi:hypothetical protein